MSAARSFEPSRSDYPLKRSDNREERNPRLHLYENFEACKVPRQCSQESL